MSQRTPTLDVYHVDSDRAGARAAARWLEARGHHRFVPPTSLARLDQCLDEAVANVLEYGGQSARASTIDLSLRIHGNATASIAALTVSDAGTPFNPLSGLRQVQARPATLAEAEPGGLGLVMIRAFSDTQTYRFDHGRNHLTFTVSWVDAA